MFTEKYTIPAGYYAPADKTECVSFDSLDDAVAIYFADPSDQDESYDIVNKHGQYIGGCSICFDFDTLTPYHLKSNTKLVLNETVYTYDAKSCTSDFVVTGFKSDNGDLELDIKFCKSGLTRALQKVDFQELKYIGCGPEMLTENKPSEDLDLSKVEIPKPLTEPVFTILGQDHIKKYIRVSAEQNMPALLVGDTGCGKTSLIKELAKEKKAKFMRVNLTGETTVDELVGKYILKEGATVWEDGVLITALKKGYWFLLDEINAALPEILFVLHSLLDDDKHVLLQQKDGELVKAHKNFRFFAAMNPVDEYAGTKELNKAFMSRFALITELKYPNKETEAQIIHNQTLIPHQDASYIADLGQKIRKAKRNNDIFYTCSTRDLIQMASLTKHLDITEAYQLSIVNKSSSEDKEFLNSLCSGPPVILGDDPLSSVTALYKKLVAKEKALDKEKEVLEARGENLDDKEREMKELVIQQLAEHITQKVS